MEDAKNKPIDGRIYFKRDGSYRLVSHIQSSPQESSLGNTYYGIITSFGDYPCMYVFIPENHPLRLVYNDDGFMGLDIPTGAGEVTGAYKPGTIPEVDQYVPRDIQAWSFGYDFGHGGDFHYNHYLSGDWLGKGYRWTVEEIEIWLRQAIKQLISYESIDPEDYNNDDYDDEEELYENNLVKIDESSLKKIVCESVKKVLSELNEWYMD